MFKKGGPVDKALKMGDKALNKFADHVDKHVRGEKESASKETLKDNSVDPSFIELVRKHDAAGVSGYLKKYDSVDRQEASRLLLDQSIKGHDDTASSFVVQTLLNAVVPLICGKKSITDVDVSGATHVFLSFVDYCNLHQIADNAYFERKLDSMVKAVTFEGAKKLPLAKDYILGILTSHAVCDVATDVHAFGFTIKGYNVGPDGKLVKATSNSEIKCSVGMPGGPTAEDVPDVKQEKKDTSGDDMVAAAAANVDKLLSGPLDTEAKVKAAKLVVDAACAARDATERDKLTQEEIDKAVAEIEAIHQVSGTSKVELHIHHHYHGDGVVHGNQPPPYSPPSGQGSNLFDDPNS